MRTAHEPTADALAKGSAADEAHNAQRLHEDAETGDHADARSETLPKIDLNSRFP